MKMTAKQLRGLPKKELVRKIIELETQLDAVKGLGSEIIKLHRNPPTIGSYEYIPPKANGVVDAAYKRDLTKPKEDLTWNEKNLVLGGRKLEAIKAVKDRLKLGLKEAKDFVDAWQEKNPNTPEKHSIRNYAAEQEEAIQEAIKPFRLNKTEKQWVQTGQVLQAVKYVKDRTGLGLRESKALVDKYRDTLVPGLIRKF